MEPRGRPPPAESTSANVKDNVGAAPDVGLLALGSLDEAGWRWGPRRALRWRLMPRPASASEMRAAAKMSFEQVKQCAKSA
jgi:hypothetical protein